jgi:hypothetical protein
LAELLDKKAQYIENNKEIQENVSMEDAEDPEIVK